MDSTGRKRSRQSATLGTPSQAPEASAARALLRSGGRRLLWGGRLGEADAEDREVRKFELVTARNQADAMVHTVRKSLAELGDKLDAGEKEKIEAALKDAEEAIKGDDKAAIEARTEALMTASQKLGEKAYAEAQSAQAAAGEAPAGGQAAGAGKAADDNVVDAEFKEVKK